MRVATPRRKNETVPPCSTEDEVREWYKLSIAKKRMLKLTARRSTKTKDKEKAKTVYEILEEVKASICDEYCRYPYQFSEDEQDDLYAICETCPLERL